MNALRQFLNERPWIGWIVALVAVVVAVLFGSGMLGSEPPDSLERRSETITIRCTESGTEWEMNRGEFERVLLTTPGMIDPDGGIPSQFAEGRPTGVLVDKDDWLETVERINRDKAEFQRR